MKYFLLPLGCQMNKSDSERVQTVIEELGYEKTEQEEEADLIGILSCSVRQHAIDRVYGKIRKWNLWKDHRNLITFISGCILEKDEKKFLKLFDLLFKVDDLPKLPEMLQQYGVVTPIQEIASRKTGLPRRKAGIRKDFEESYWDITPQYSSPFQAYVPIQNGCDKFCTFCAVPYTRGREISRPSAEILAEVQSLIDKDYKSITLLGQNVNSYGLDKEGNEVSFSELLEKIGQMGEVSGKEFWVYFTSPHPRDMKEDVLRVIARYSTLAKQIHLPIQSGDDEVLQKMNRSYNLKEYRAIVEQIHKILPTATLFTDIIVGFHGESEAAFENTRNVMDEFKYQMVYIAKYSMRPGAVSSRWMDSIPDEVKKNRFEILTQDLQKISYQHNLSMIGKTYRVLVENSDRKNGFLSGKTEGRIVVRFSSENTSQIGNFVDVKITKTSMMSVEGEKVEKEEFTRWVK